MLVVFKKKSPENCFVKAYQALFATALKDVGPFESRVVTKGLWHF